MRKTISILLAFTFFICLPCGCSKSKSDEDTTSKKTVTTEEDPSSRTTESEPPYYSEVLDREGTLLGRIDGRANASAADEGIFYSVFEPAEYAATAEAQYRFFRASDGKDILLGTLEEQGYETIYSRTEMDGVVYTLALTGNPNDDVPDPLWLLAFDLEHETMNKVRISEDASPYAAMTAINGKVLIMVHEFSAPKYDRVFSFDAASGDLSEVLSFPSEGDSCVSLRGLYADASHLYLLRLALRSEAGIRTNCIWIPTIRHIRNSPSFP